MPLYVSKYSILNIVLVADSDNNRVVIFNTTGQVIHSFQVGSIPCGLAIDHNGDLLVTLYGDKHASITAVF